MPPCHGGDRRFESDRGRQPQILISPPSSSDSTRNRGAKAGFGITASRTNSRCVAFPILAREIFEAVHAEMNEEHGSVAAACVIVRGVTTRLMEADTGSVRLHSHASCPSRPGNGLLPEGGGRTRARFPALVSAFLPHLPKGGGCPAPPLP